MTNYAGPAILDRVAPSEETLVPIGERTYEQALDTQPSYGYYRKPDGDITVDVYSPMEQLKYLQRGWEALPQYGRFDMTTEYAANHPFEALFMLGGAKEMTLKQVMENGFHIDEPGYHEDGMVGIEIPGCGLLMGPSHPKHKKTCFSMRYRVVFPQLEGIEAKAWHCEYCEEIRPSKRGLDAHMASAHKEERGNLRTGSSIAAAIVEGMRAPSLPAAVDEDTVERGELALMALGELASLGLNKRQKELLTGLGYAVDVSEAEETDGD